MAVCLIGTSMQDLAWQLHTPCSQSLFKCGCHTSDPACSFLLLLLLLPKRFDPAITAVPLMTTCVDSTGLVIYFYIAQLVLGINGHQPSG